MVAGYEPTLDPSKVVGAWYVGYPEDMQSLNDVISNGRMFKQEFVALFDGRVRSGFIRAPKPTRR